MISLATIGFIVGAVLFAWYAYSLKPYVDSKSVSGSYPWAYYLLAITFLLWGIAAASGSQNFLNLSVLIGNAFILAGSVLLLATLIRQKGAILAAGVIAIILFLVRILYFPPAPYMQEGILVFNTNLIVGVAYIILFIGIWLPANLSIGRAVGSRAGIPEFTRLLQSLFALSIVAALFMPVARTPAVVGGAFAAIVVCYAVLIAANMSLRKKLK